MLRYTIRRFLGLIPVLFGISFLIFTVLRLIPGDPALAMLGERATPQQLAQIRAQLGLDKKLFFDFSGERNVFDTQYFGFMRQLLSGDLGTSIVRRTNVSTELSQRFPATLELTLAALLIAVVVGILIGIIASLRRGSAIDAGSTVFALIGVSIPIFWLGLMMQYLFAVNLGWLPVSQRLDTEFSRGFQGVTGLYVLDGLLLGRPQLSWNAIKHLIMPAIALSTVPMAIIARMTRSAMLEVLSQDYVRTAKAKGLRSRIVVMRHALRNALLPVVTIIGLQLGGLLSGAILTETVFSWPGIGTWIYAGVQGRDYPIVQSGIIFVAFVFVVVNLLVDLSYAFLDPRIQHR
ncbi:MAG: ABC transporter permease [Chloroflexota bacterium]|nr:ABC transporter permease [Chloroflexota bacterium]PLS77283.1 MAG: peptide ABC transporter permease [Chloroflexota bacterium]